jgi:hypothetical protein
MYLKLTCSQTWFNGILSPFFFSTCFFAEFAADYERLQNRRAIDAGAGTSEGYENFKKLFNGSYNMRREKESGEGSGGGGKRKKKKKDKEEGEKEGKEEEKKKKRMTAAAAPESYYPNESSYQKKRRERKEAKARIREHASMYGATEANKRKWKKQRKRRRPPQHHVQVRGQTTMASTMSSSVSQSHIRKKF